MSYFTSHNMRVAQKVMPHIFFLGNYLIRMYETHAQYNWMFPLHVLFFRWPLVPKFAGSNPAETDELLKAKKSSARLPSEGK